MKKKDTVSHGKLMRVLDISLEIFIIVVRVCHKLTMAITPSIILLLFMIMTKNEEAIIAVIAIASLFYGIATVVVPDIRYYGRCRK